MKAKGSVLKYGDNVDTDVIIPARYLNSYDAKELASHAMVDIDPTFVERLNPGDIVVGGKNFGCGSSKRTRSSCFKNSGSKLCNSKIICKNFYRNSINIGFAILECEEAAEDIDEGNQVEIDFDKGIIYNLTKKSSVQGRAIS